VLCVSGKFGDLLTYATFASLLFYFLIFGVFILRRENLMLKGLIVLLVIRLCRHCIIVTTAICITLLVYDTLNTGLGLGIVALGIPVYYFLMDNKKNSEGTAGQSFNSPCFNCNLCRE
jgi:APA family basic amino acid/polyamine antiporter